MKTYFDHNLLHNQIVAALVLAPYPLNVASLLRVCPAAPDTQAVSDSLRRLKRKGLAELLPEEKRWIPGPNAKSIAKEDLEQVDLSLLRQPHGHRRISQAELETETVKFLQANVQRGKNVTHFTEILDHFRGRNVDRHRLSQVLYILKQKDLIGSPEKTSEDAEGVFVRFYYPKPPKKSSNMSLFDDLEDTSAQTQPVFAEPIIDLPVIEPDDFDPSISADSNQVTEKPAPKTSTINWRLKLRQAELKRNLHLQQIKRTT